MKKICCLFNYAPHYREAVFREMDHQLGCDFYFGTDLREKIKKADCTQLKGFRGELKNIYWKNWVWRKGIIAIALKKEYDTFLITGEPHTLSLIPFKIICLLLGKRVFSWQHGISNPNISRAKLFNQKLLISLETGVFLYGNWARRVMIDCGFSPGKLHVIYNSLDYDHSLMLRDKLGHGELYRNHFGNNAPTLLFIGRLTRIKQLPMLVNAFIALNRLKLHCNLVFIGDGEMHDELEQQAILAGFEKRIWFIGAVYDEAQIANYLSNADLCVSPGNVGLTAIHALSYGLPVITNNNFSTQMPEYEAIEACRSGLFFKEGNMQSLLETIREWLFSGKYNDRELNRINCYKKIDTYYNPRHQVEILKRVLQA